MKDTFKSMTELLASLPEKDNYFFKIDATHGSKVKIFAPHGGCIEPGTSPIVLELAEGTFDYYIFHAIRKTRCNQTLHVTSANYDEPGCLRMARDAQVAVAFHGCDGLDSFIEIGGGHPALADGLKGLMSAAGYPVVPASPDLKGERKRNFINQASIGGVQLELSKGLRQSLFADFPRSLQRNPNTLQPFIQTIRGWLKTIEEGLNANQSFLPGTNA